MSVQMNCVYGSNETDEIDGPDILTFEKSKWKNEWKFNQKKKKLSRMTMQHKQLHIIETNNTKIQNELQKPTHTHSHSYSHRSLYDNTFTTSFDDNYMIEGKQLERVNYTSSTRDRR